MTDDLGTPCSYGPQDSEIAAEQLRFRASLDADEVAGILLAALVPAFADVAVVYAAEDVFRGGGPGFGDLRPLRVDDAGRMTVRRAGSRFNDGGEGSAAFPPGAPVAFAAGSPMARCAAEGKALAFANPREGLLNRTSPEGRAVLARYSSFLAVPLDADGTAAGLIALARRPSRPPFGGDGDTAEITRLAAYAGTGISRIMTAYRHQAVAEALQQGLRAAEPARPRNLDVSGRCRPAGHVVGGDWYDLIALPGGRTGIIVGDVMGHGPQAAAVMAQMRAAGHALARLDPAPAWLLARLNDLIEALPGAPMATCLYAVLDPAMESCTLSAAGHLPPVLARPGHVARVLDLPSGMSLGVAAADFGQASIRLRPGTTIAFYTDGLVETRRRSFEQGITALRAELDRPGKHPLDLTRDRITGALAANPEDDVTLVLARIPGGEPSEGDTPCR